MAVVASVLVTVVVTVGVYSWLVLPETCIPYDPELISVDVENGNIYGHYLGKYFAGSCGLNPTTVKTEEGEKQIACFYFVETPWSKYIEPLYQKERKEDAFRFYIGKTDQIDEVYYGNFDETKDYLEIFENLPDTIKDLEKVWQKH